jgi:hypothetical protein
MLDIRKHANFIKMLKMVPIIWIVLIGLFVSDVALAQKQNVHLFTIGKNALPFHASLLGQKLRAWWPPSNEHDVFFMEDMLDAAGLKRDVLMMETDFPNVFALIATEDAAGRRLDQPIKMIIYNLEWITKDAFQSDIYPIRYLVIGHELGHHLCKHTAGRLVGRSWEKELEADRAAGALIRLLAERGSAVTDLTLAQVIQAARNFYRDDPGSATHPPGYMRILAIQQGWNNGSSCLALP